MGKGKGKIAPEPKPTSKQVLASKSVKFSDDEVEFVHFNQSDRTMVVSVQSLVPPDEEAPIDSIESASKSLAKFRSAARSSVANKTRNRRQSLHDVVRKAYDELIQPQKKDHTHDEIHLERALTRHLSLSAEDMDRRLADHHVGSSKENEDAFKKIPFEERVEIASFCA